MSSALQRSIFELHYQILITRNFAIFSCYLKRCLDSDHLSYIDYKSDSSLVANIDWSPFSAMYLISIREIVLAGVLAGVLASESKYML